MHTRRPPAVLLHAYWFSRCSSFCWYSGQHSVSRVSTYLKRQGVKQVGKVRRDLGNFVGFHRKWSELCNCCCYVE